MTYLLPNEYSKILSTENGWTFYQITFDPTGIKKKILTGLHDGHIYWDVVNIYDLFNDNVPTDTITVPIYKSRYKKPTVKPTSFITTKVFLSWFLDVYQKNGFWFERQKFYTPSLFSSLEALIHKLFQIQLEVGTDIENFAKDARMFFCLERLTWKGRSSAPWDGPDAGKPLTTKQIHDFKKEILGIGVDNEND